MDTITLASVVILLLLTFGLLAWRSWSAEIDQTGIKHNENPPFEYVYLESDSRARELTTVEKIYLRTSYHGNDGDRPYVKSSFHEKTTDGSSCGFILRTALPSDLVIGPARFESSEAEVQQAISTAKRYGYKIDLRGIKLPQNL